jgi:hypothetical protein
VEWRCSGVVGMGITGSQAGGVAAFAVVDLETTGLYPSKDRVVEIAVVQLKPADRRDVPGSGSARQPSHASLASSDPQSGTGLQRAARRGSVKAVNAIRPRLTATAAPIVQVRAGAVRKAAATAVTSSARMTGLASIASLVRW